MRLDARAFGLATGATAAALFILCALAVAVAPGPTTAFAGYLIHTDLSGLSRSLTLGNFVGGLICWALGTALTSWLVAAIYNRLVRAPSTAPVIEPRPAAQRT
jgi:membrane protein YqaA with SNARE-associated domain